MKWGGGDRINMDGLRGSRMDERGSKSCPVPGFGTDGVEFSGSATNWLLDMYVLGFNSRRH